MRLSDCIHICLMSRKKSCSSLENGPSCMRVHYLRTSEHVHDCVRVWAQHFLIISTNGVQCLFQKFFPSSSFLSRFFSSSTKTKKPSLKTSQNMFEYQTCIYKGVIFCSIFVLDFLQMSSSIVSIILTVMVTMIQWWLW